MTRVRAIRAIILVLLISLCGIVVPWVLPSAGAQGNASIWGLVGNIVSPNVTLNSVFMMDANTAWLAGSDSSQGGSNGRAYKIVWRNGQWVLDSTYSFRAPLKSIVAISDNNVWAVGDNKLIVHKDATGWQEIPQANGLSDYSNYTTIQMFGNGEEGWAAGTTSSQPENLGFFAHLKDGQVNGISVTAGGDIKPGITSLHFAGEAGWAVGRNSIARFEDSGAGVPSWVIDTVLPTCQADYNCGYNLLAVRAINSNDAWASGFRLPLSSPPVTTEAVLLHRINGQWQQVNVSLSGFSNILSGLSFSNDGFGLAVGGTIANIGDPSYPVVLGYREDKIWREENYPKYPGSALLAISQFDSTHALAVGTSGLILSYGYGAGVPLPVPTVPGQVYPTPTPYVDPPTYRVADPQRSEITYFPLVGHTLRGGFRDFWQSHGGVAQFGYPITEEYNEISATNGRSYVTQWFERARMEWHPGEGLAIDVQLGLLGRDVTKGRENEPEFKPVPAPTQPNAIYFKETGHTLAPELAIYWQTTGGLPVYGFPISEPFLETSKTDGKPYLVQYFERNRLEYHPEAPTAYRVQLGLLGVDLLRARGWLP